MALEQITFNIGAFNDSDAGGNNYFTNTVFEVKNQSDNTFATIYADSSGTTQIPQNGIDNVSNSRGECNFYIDDGDFYLEVNSQQKNFNIGNLKTDFANIDEVKAYSKLSKLIGQRITTGEYHAGTGYGGATYEVVSAGSVTPNDIDIIQGVADSGAAVILRKSGTMLIEQFGAGSFDSSDSIERAILSCTGSYNISTNLNDSVLDRPLYFFDASVSDIDIDFSKCAFSLTGARTEGTTFDWEYGAFTFHGEVTNTTQDTTLSSTLGYGRNFWQVSDSSQFADGDFIIIEVDPDNDPDNGGDFSTKIVWKMVKVTKIDSSTQIRTDYIRAYDIGLGTKIRYTKVNPVSNVSFKAKSLTYDRAYNGTNQDKLEASSGVVFYIAENCSVDKFKYNRNPKQAAHFEFTHRCKAERVEMRSPIEVGSGGYCTQFAKSMLFEVNAIDSDEDRHLFDITASSNGKVTNSGGSDTTNSTFTTHGTYEHDVIYDGNYGHFQIAGSGTGFGESARSIKVINHNGTILKANAKVVDLTIEDSHFISTADVNVDGLVMSRVIINNDIRFKKLSSDSERDNVIKDCTLSFGGIPAFDSGVDVKVKFIRTKFPNAYELSFSSYADIYMKDCELTNDSSASNSALMNTKNFTLDGGVSSGFNYVFNNDTNQSVEILGGVEIDSGNRSNLGLFTVTKTAGDFEFSALSAKSQNLDRHLTAAASGANLKIKCFGWNQAGGSNRVDLAALGNGFLLFSNNVQEGVTNTFPANDGVKVITGNNISI